MKKKELVDFTVASILILVGAVILVLPLLNVTCLKYILPGIFILYAVVNLFQFVLTKESRDLEGLLTVIASVFTLGLSLFLDIKVPLNLAIIIFTWVSLMSLIKLKKCDYYHDRLKKIWILKIITLVLFILIGLLTVINLYYEETVQILIIGYFCFIHGVLELVDPVTNFLMGTIK